MLRTGIYLQKLSDEVRRKSIIDMDDLLSKRYQRETGYNHAKGFNQLDNRIVNTGYKLLGSLITKYEAYSMEKLEKQIVELNTLIALVSNEERKELAKMVDDKFEHYIVHLPLTGSKKRGEVRDINELEKNRIGFIGNLSLKSNYEGLCYFLNQNYSFLSMNNIEVDIIGKTPIYAKNQLQKIGNKNKITISVRGFVPKLSSFTNKWLFAIAPNRSGTGINTKIFDYLSFGLPVIGYKYSFRGFEKLIDKYLFDVDENNIKDIYNYYSGMTLEKYLDISKDEIDMYNTEYSIETLRNKLEKLYNRL
jgi:hypothetical protein